MADLRTIRRDYQNAILEGMARSLWVWAYMNWAMEEHRCERCDKPIHTERDPEDGELIWVAEDGTPCAEDDDFITWHEPSQERRKPEMGGDWNKTAPETPSGAYLAARDLTKLIAAAEGLRDKHPLADLYELAMTVDTGEFQFHPLTRHPDIIKSARDFGSDLAMEALDTGASWGDRHRTKRDGAEFAPKLPRFEVHFTGTDLSWNGSERVGAGRQAGRQDAIYDDGEIIDSNELGRITIINRNNYSRHQYLLEHVGSLYLVYADSDDEAFDELIDWADDNAPGLLADDAVNSMYQELKREKEAELGRSLDESGGSPADRRIVEKLQEEAEVDTMQGGNAGHYLHPHEWAIVGVDLTPQELLDISFRENPKRNAGVGASDLTRSVLAARDQLDAQTGEAKCDASCPGWAVFDADRGLEIEACDECNSMADRAGRSTVSDDDVARLPQARAALAAALAENDMEGMEDNPAGLTSKGERMYKAIEKGYRKVGEARAKEVAARTVLSRARQGTRGLIKPNSPAPECPRGCGGSLRRDTYYPDRWRCTKCGNAWTDAERVASERRARRQRATPNSPAPKCPRECGGDLRRDTSIPDIWRCQKCGRGWNEDALRTMTADDRRAIAAHARRQRGSS